MIDNSVVDDINKNIKVHGTNQYGDPLFRVVFSDDQTEKRNGIYDDYSGNIYIRTVREIREVKKYPWIKGKWILERWAPGETSYHPSLKTDKNGVYICVYVFQDVNQNYLPPLLKVAEIVINNLLHPRSSGEMIAEDKEILAKEEEVEVDKIEKEIVIQSDEVATKDPKSRRESMSSGYTKDYYRRIQTLPDDSRHRVGLQVKKEKKK